MKKFMFIAVFCAAITSCTTAPTHFIVSTNPVVSTNVPITKHIAIHVTDPRARQAILRTTNQGKHSYLSAQEPTVEFVKQGLSAHLKQRAIGVSDNAGDQLLITIDKMALKLDQGTISYQTRSLIVFNVIINNGNQTLKKTFKRQGTSKGPFKADIAVLEQDFNQLLTLIYSDISQDPQVKSYLNL